jgi:hypothetical protein
MIVVEMACEGRRTGNDQAAPASILGRQQSVNFLPLPQMQGAFKAKSVALCRIGRIWGK